MARDCRAESQLYICRMECDVVWIGSEEDGQCYYCAIRFAALLAVWRSCLPWRATACVLFVSLIDWKVGRGRVSFERAEKRMDDKLSPSPCFSSFCAVFIFFLPLLFFLWKVYGPRSGWLTFCPALFSDHGWWTSYIDRIRRTVWKRWFEGILSFSSAHFISCQVLLLIIAIRSSSTL